MGRYYNVYCPGRMTSVDALKVARGLINDTLVLKHPAGNNIPTTYILTVARGVKPENDDFAKHAEKAKKRGWQMMQMEADHNPQWSAPEALAEMFLKLAVK